MKLGSEIASADSASVQEQLKTQASEALRSHELLQMLSKQQLPPHVLPAQMADLIHDPTVELQFQAEIATVQQSIAKLEATVPMARSREADYQQLVGNGYVSDHATQDKTRERVEQERDLSVQRARLNEV